MLGISASMSTLTSLWSLPSTAFRSVRITSYNVCYTKLLRNPLYRLVLERYVSMATEAGVVQAVFLEGSLTRDGSLRPPKLGLLDYMARSFHPGWERDIVFIPVGINYDRTFEDRSQLMSLSKREQRKNLASVIGTSLRFLLRNLV